MDIQEINDAISDALLTYSDEQATRPPYAQRLGGNLSRFDCDELAEVARLAINGAGWVISDESNE